MSEGIFLGQPTLAGPPGDQGTTAYELAVAEGFIGTQAEWLASLVGPEGPQGVIGPEGPEGPQGPAGQDGADPDPNTLLATQADALEAGFISIVEDLGVAAGTVTPSVVTPNLKALTNNAAFTLAAPSLAANTATAIGLLITNGASAGAITASGFDRVTGDAFTALQGDKFRCHIEAWNVGGATAAHLHVVALQ